MMTLTLRCRVTPKAATTKAMGWQGEYLKVRVAALPEKGAANKALVRYLAEMLGVAQSQIVLISGVTSRDKCLRLEGITEEALFRTFGKM